MNHETNKSLRAGTQAEAQAHRAPAAPALGSDTSKGAPLSNTAPANYIDESTRIFRTGVDSLYLSWSGTLDQEFDDLLLNLKKKAQSPNPAEQSQAVVQLLDHRFEVSDKGKGRFPFVLQDNWFHIQVSRSSSTSMPLATAQISSELLTKSGYLTSTRKLEALISQIGTIEQQKISRIDICVDFFTEFDLEVIPRITWVNKASKLTLDFDGFKFTGFSFGKGGKIVGRLYDKAWEIEKESKKTFFYPIWAEGCWLGELPVWRMEFQFRREPLKDVGIDSTQDLDEKLNGLWQYACQNWLRLTLPSNTDTARTRWPCHPLWKALQEARFGTGSLQPLTRTRKERLPSDERLYVHGLSTLTSVMAETGISDLNEALKAMAQKAHAFHRNRRESGYSFGTYLKAKVAQKARKFNTRLDVDPRDDDPDAYRKAKEGE